MTRSFKFWAGALMLALLPVLLIDIARHTLDWRKEVREEMINLAYEPEAFTDAQRELVLDTIFGNNRDYTAKAYVKSFLVLVFLVSGIYLLRSFLKTQHGRRLKPVLFTVALAGLVFCLHVFLLPQFIFNRNIKFGEVAKTDTTLRDFYETNFKGKVVYVDFWGTACGPCLYEFRHFTRPLKSKYRGKNVAFLYICCGQYLRHKYLWKEQIKKYNIEGTHVYLEYEQFDKIYRYLRSDPKAEILLPRYLILDKKGGVVNTDARRPSDKDSLHLQLNKYL